MESVTGRIKSLIKSNKDFPQQFKQRLVHESTNVKNPFNFIVGLFNEGVLSDELNQHDSNFGLTAIIVQLVMMMACSRGADAIGGFVRALEASGNVGLISALRTWLKDDFAVEADGHLRSPQKRDVSVAHTGTELVDSMMSKVKHELMVQFAGGPCNIAHFAEDASNLTLKDYVLEEPNIEFVVRDSSSNHSQRLFPNIAHHEVQNEPNIASPWKPGVVESRPTQNVRKPIKTESKFSEAKGANSAVQTASEVSVKQNKEAKELSSYGTKLIDKIMSRVDNGLIEPLESYWVGKASEFINVPEFCSSLVRQMLWDEYDVQLVTGPKVQEGQKIEKVIKVVCSKKAIGSLVVALENSNNERMLAETCKWLEGLPPRDKDDPISVTSLGSQTEAPATGIFAATTEGLISLDLRTLNATALTSEWTCAVAVNHNLKKVYWSEGWPKCHINRSNFDGSAKEIIVQHIGDRIWALAIDTASDNVYFALFHSHEIQVCNALGDNCDVVISNPSLVNNPIGIALDSSNGFIYWGKSRSGSQSVDRAKLDGSSSTIISTGFKNLFGITLDQTSKGVLYWTDDRENTIGTVDVNNGKNRTLVELERDSGLWGIQVDDDKIYFSTGGNRTIQSVDKYSGKGLTTIFESVAP